MQSMVGKRRDRGLSEVIGFILLIALLVLISSLYITYVVPAQGREAEIAHMDYIQNQFFDLKMNIDSLWINTVVNRSVSQVIKMGTLQQQTGGQFVALPLTQPVGSAGELAVDTSGSSGTMTVEINGYFKDAPISSGENQILVNPDANLQYLYTQSMNPVQTINRIQIPVSTSIPTDPNDFSTDQSISYHLLDIYPNSTTDVATANWTASFDLLRIPSFSVPKVNATTFATSKSPYQMKANYRYDLVMNLTKRNVSAGETYPVFQNFTLSSSEKRPGDYYVNLQDPAYGLDIFGPITVKDSNSQVHSGSLTIAQNWDSTLRSYYVSPLSSSLAKGSLSYTAHNYYWVDQEYTYQMGGVFLNQSGDIVPKVLPLITLSSGQDGVPELSITKLNIIGVEGTMGGSYPVQVSSKVSAIRKGILTDNNGKYHYLAPVQKNAQKVNVTIGNLDDRGKKENWKNVFNAIIYSAYTTSGFDKSKAVVDDSLSNTVTLSITDDCTINYSEVDLKILLEPIGWSS